MDHLKPTELFLGLESGFYSKQEVIEWADSYLITHDYNDHVANISLASRKSPQGVLALLDPLSRDYCRVPAMRAVLARMSTELEKDADAAWPIVRYCEKFWVAEGYDVPRDMHFIEGIYDNFDLACRGLVGTKEAAVDQLKKNLAEFRQPLIEARMKRRLSERVKNPPAEEDRRFFFLSYTTREEETARLKAILDPALKMIPEQTWREIGVWYDVVDMYDVHVYRLPREEIREKLIAGIEKSDFTLAMISPIYLQRDWCHFEWVESVKRHMPPAILPVCWKETRYLRHLATWTEPYSVPWTTLYDLAPLEAAEKLADAVVSYIRQHRPYDAVPY